MAEIAPMLQDDTRQLLHEQHAMMREVVSGLDATTLRWQPAPETNSIAQLISHALETERFLVATAGDQSVARDREAAFVIADTSTDDLLALVDVTEHEVDILLLDINAAA